MATTRSSPQLAAALVSLAAGAINPKRVSRSGPLVAAPCPGGEQAIEERVASEPIGCPLPTRGPKW